MNIPPIPILNSAFLSTKSLSDGYCQFMGLKLKIVEIMHILFGNMKLSFTNISKVLTR